MMKAILLLAAGCGASSSTTPTTGSGSGSGSSTITDARCTANPDAGPATGFRNLTSNAIAVLPAQHRGTDVVASQSDAITVTGTIVYGTKALEDEDVDVFACDANAWTKLGTARTDGEGHFSLPAQLAIGMRDMFVSVAGDRTGARFLAYVAPDASPLIVTDIDGTLTSSENAAITSLGNPGAQPGAAAAMSDAVGHGYQVVYLTARGAELTGVTRDWLARNNFPRGPLRLADAIAVLPGSDTTAAKTQMMQALDASLPIYAGVGNRATDVDAYTNVGIAPDHIFVLMPEFADELSADLSAGKAQAFTSYAAWQQSFVDQLP